MVDSLVVGLPAHPCGRHSRHRLGVLGLLTVRLQGRSMQLAVLQTPLTPALQASVLARQRQLQAPFRQVDPAGQLITYLDKHFVVYPTVFWPSDTSKPLVQHWEIAPGERVLDLCTGPGSSP